MSISSDRRLYIKAVLIGVFVSVAVIAILMCILCAVFLSISKLPHDYLPYLLLIIDGVGVFVGAYACARITGERGLVMGLICGALVFLSLVIAGMTSGTDTIGLLTLLRAAVTLLCGTLGGIKGVNRKEKIHIK